MKMYLSYKTELIYVFNFIVYNVSILQETRILDIYIY